MWDEWEQHATNFLCLIQTRDIVVTVCAFIPPRVPDPPAVNYNDAIDYTEICHIGPISRSAQIVCLRIA